MALLQSIPLNWFDDKSPEIQFAAFSLLSTELGETVPPLSPELLRARSSETVRIWLQDLDLRFQQVSRAETIIHLKEMTNRILDDWEADFHRHGFLPKAPNFTSENTDEGSTVQSRLIESARRSIRAGIPSESLATQMATYALTIDDEGAEVTTSQVTTFLKECGLSPSNASATIQSLAEKKIDPALLISGKTNRGKRQEWLFRLTPAARRSVGEMLKINAND